MPQRTKEEKAAYWNSYYKTNKEKLLASQREKYALTLTEEKKEKKRQRMRKRYAEHRDRIIQKSAERAKERRKSDPEFKKQERERRLKRKEKTSLYSKNYYQANKSVIKQRVKAWRKNNKRDTTPTQVMAHRCRATIQSILRRRGWKKVCKTNEMLGCDWTTLKLHIETQFKKGMTWDNRDQWHIDHYIPLASAKSSEDVIKLNHYTNLRPLWKHENQSKSASLCHKGHQIPLLLQ